MQNLLRMIGFGENLGSGFPSILDACKQEQWRKPDLDENTDTKEVQLRLWMISMFPEEAEPQLVPGSDDRLFVPADVNRKLREAQMAERAGMKQPPQENATAQSAAPAQKPPANPAQNRDAAIDPIFPKTVDSRQMRKPHKQDRNFDLNNVFPMQEMDAAQPRRHAPIPPEVPLRPGTRTAASAQKPVTPAQKPAAPAQKPTTAAQRPAAPMQKPATAAQRPAVAPQRPVTPGAKAPSLSAIRPQGASPAGESAAKPVIRKAEASKNKDFGLSSEEFEKLEATTQGSTAKSKSPTAKSAAKPASEAKATKKSTTKAEAGAQKDASAKSYVFPPISYLRAGEPMTAENNRRRVTTMPGSFAWSFLLPIF